MTRQDPFLRLLPLLPREAGEPAPRPLDDTIHVVSEGAAHIAVEAIDRGISPLFDAALSGVQLRFKHLDPADIVAPPHAWFDAALARQIVVHLMNRTFGVPKRAIASDILRSREAVNRALRTVDERMEDPHFAASYEAMKRHALFHARRKKTRLNR